MNYWICSISHRQIKLSFPINLSLHPNIFTKRVVETLPFSLVGLHYPFEDGEGCLERGRSLKAGLKCRIKGLRGLKASF